MIGVGCICGEIAAPEISRQVYINPDQPHTHNEQMTPLEMTLVTVEAGSTAVLSGANLLSSWNRVPDRPSFRWRVLPTST
jgi:hypothetical protein